MSFKDEKFIWSSLHCFLATIILLLDWCASVLVVSKFNILATKYGSAHVAYAHVPRALPTLLASLYKRRFPFAAFCYRGLDQIVI